MQRTCPPRSPRQPSGRDARQGLLWDQLLNRPEPAPLEGNVSLCVLASSSRGNCSVLIHERPHGLYRLTLIDAGLSPRRTRALLASIGLDIAHVDDVIFTHLDFDHCRPTWRRALPAHARFHVHRRHRGRAERLGLLTRRTEVFEHASFPLKNAIIVSPIHLAHDDLGVAAFRFDFGDHHRSSMGYATDVGHVTEELVHTLQGVDVLAIESNYCPQMQIDSPRPWYLKRRIMGGRGHLSNEESRRAVELIMPRRHIVLLHLSQECNTPETAGRHHEEHGCAVVTASPSKPSARIHVAGPESPSTNGTTRIT